MSFSNLTQALGRMFHVHEFNESPSLGFVFYALLMQSVLVFVSWRDAGILAARTVADNAHVCWPYFPSCGALSVFNDMPAGYSLGILYAAVGMCVVLACIYAFRHEWTKALIFFGVVTLFKFGMVYFATYTLPTNYNAFALYVSIALLCSRHKVFALKSIATVFYYLAAINKLHAGYLSGDVFTSLSLGLPFVPASLTHLAGLAFIALLLIAPTLLWTESARIRKYASVALITFHTATITIVGFVYPILCIPLVLLAQGLSSASLPRFTIRTHGVLICIVSVMVIGQLFPLFITGDNRITGEGTKFGFSMYDANHQCTGYLERFTHTNASELTPYQNGMAMGICDPYILWFKSRTLCAQKDTMRVALYMQHSINGGPYYEVVNEANICTLPYSLWSHNPWVHTDRILGDNPPQNSFLLSL
jgi:hypothetical protein